MGRLLSRVSRGRLSPTRPRANEAQDKPLLTVSSTDVASLVFGGVGRIALKDAWRLEHAGAAGAGFDAIWDHDRAVKRVGTKAALSLVVGFTFVVAVDAFFATFGH